MYVSSIWLWDHVLDWEWGKKIRERKENKGKKGTEVTEVGEAETNGASHICTGLRLYPVQMWGICTRYLTRYKYSTTFVSDALYRFDTRYKWGLWTGGTNVCFSNSVQTPQLGKRKRWIQCHSMSSRSYCFPVLPGHCSLCWLPWHTCHVAHVTCQRGVTKVNVEFYFPEVNMMDVCVYREVCGTQTHTRRQKVL
jgi:hypothetical protein